MRVLTGARGLMTSLRRVILLQPWKSFRAGKDLSLDPILAAELVGKGWAEYETQNKSIATPEHRKAVRKKGGQ